MFCNFKDQRDKQDGLNQNKNSIQPFIHPKGDKINWILSKPRLVPPPENSEGSINLVFCNLKDQQDEQDGLEQGTTLPNSNTIGQNLVPMVKGQNAQYLCPKDKDLEPGTNVSISTTTIGQNSVSMVNGQNAQNLCPKDNKLLCLNFDLDFRGQNIVATMWHKQQIYNNVWSNGQSIICPRGGKVIWKLSKPRFMPPTSLHPPENSGGATNMPRKNKRQLDWFKYPNNKKRKLNDHKDALLDLWQPGQGPAIGFATSFFDEEEEMGVEIPPPPKLDS